MKIGCADAAVGTASLLRDVRVATAEMSTTNKVSNIRERQFNTYSYLATTVFSPRT